MAREGNWLKSCHSSLSHVACLVGGTEDGMRGREKQLLEAFLHRVSRGKRKQNQTLDAVP